MSAPLRMAIVGCGDVAGYAAALARLTPGLRLAACCDASLERAQAFARRHAIPAAHQDYAQLLAAGGLDLVYLAVPHDLHLPMTRAAVERGLAVLCEKPIAATLAQGRELLEVARTPGAHVAVNYQYRYAPTCYTLVQAARAGAFGRLLYARAHIPWRREPAYFAGLSNWHASPLRSGGGTLLTQGSHFLDLLLWAMDSRPLAAAGVTRNLTHPAAGVEDLAVGLLELENGALIEIVSTMAAPREKPAVIELVGERGSARWQDGLFPSLRFEGVAFPPICPPARGLHPLQRSLAAFAAWLRGGPPHLGDPATALTTLAAVDAIYRAAACGSRTEIA